MENKYKVRIMRSEIRNIKNVAYGDVMYMNYGSINKKAMCDKTDIVGIYGQNGSGKTALVESLDMLRQILTGSPINYEMYEGILSKDGTSCIRTEFFVWIGEEKYKVVYQASLRVDEKEKAIQTYMEELRYWKRGASWKSERDISFCNPYYGNTDVLETHNISVTSNHLSRLSAIPFLTNMQNLALICAQKNISVFFNQLVKTNIEKLEDSMEVRDFRNVILGILQFAYVDFNVIKVNQLGTINNNQIIPINVHKETETEIMQAIMPLAISGVTEIPQEDYVQVKIVVDAINMAIKSVIPNLQIRLKEKMELERPDGTKAIQVEVYSVRDGKEFLLRYESEGIKRIISILNYLISVYNNEGVCLVVDELDSGIFEYLLGELLGMMHSEMKGQLIFTSHNLRILEKLDVKNIVCSTVNPQNRYIRLKGIEKNHNKRDFYIRAITVGGQNEELYDEDDLLAMGYAFRKAGKVGTEQGKLTFSPDFEKRLQESENRG